MTAASTRKTRTIGSQLKALAAIFNAVAPFAVLGLVYLGGKDVLASRRLVESAQQEQRNLEGQTAELLRTKYGLITQKKELELKVLQLENINNASVDGFNTLTCSFPYSDTINLKVINKNKNVIEFTPEEYKIVGTSKNECTIISCEFRKITDTNIWADVTLKVPHRSRVYESKAER